MDLDQDRYPGFTEVDELRSGGRHRARVPALKSPSMSHLGEVVGGLLRAAPA